MKNKALKILGVGALALVGTASLTGCSINNDQMKLLEDKVAQIGQYAEYLNQKLADANQKLDEQNDLIEEQSNLINQQTLVDRAWGLLQTAQAKLMMNIDGVRDNLVMENTVGGQTQTQEFYKTQSGINVYCDSNKFVYGDSTGVYRYDEGHNTIKIGYDRIENYYNYLRVFEITGGVLNKERITSVEILENGDYKVNLACNFENEDGSCNGVYCYIVSSDARMISLSGSTFRGDRESEWSYLTLNASYKFKYGEVNVEQILTKLAEAQARK